MDDHWDRFESARAYDAFTRAWMLAVRRVMKPDATIWVSGSYHNIFRVGATMQDLGFWTLNDVAWVKTNPMPNFRGRRLQNAHETLIWASRAKDLALHVQLRLHEGGQRRSAAPLGVDAAHSARAPSGSRTPRGASCTRPRSRRRSSRASCPSAPGPTTWCSTRSWAREPPAPWRVAWGGASLGVERERAYAEAARARIEAVEPHEVSALRQLVAKRSQPRVPFLSIVEAGLIAPGATIRDASGNEAVVRADGTVASGTHEGSIHSVGAAVRSAPSCNGWTHWRTDDGNPIDALRERIRQGMNAG